MTQKLKMRTPDLTQANIEKIAELFPNVITEIADEDGKLKKGVDFDLLKQALSDVLVEDENERYRLDWPGKKRSLLKANTPIDKTLRPCREESVNFDTTENLYIEGDNFEVLKILQESYLGKVKMIYIDPPYNTGSDFIYKDNYKVSKEEYEEELGALDEEGGRLFKNTDSNGRFHSDWLSMMYERLVIARDLLKDDGVIFISIDDNEVHNLRKICDDTFGEENFIGKLIWKVEGHTDNQFDLKVNHEYILVYTRNSSTCSLGYVIDPNVRKESNLWKGYAENSITKNGPANPPSEVLLPRGFPVKGDALSLEKHNLEESFFKEINSLGHISREITKKYDASYPVRLSKMVASKGSLEQDCIVFSGWANVDKLKQFINNGFNPLLEPDGSKLSFFISQNGVIYYNRIRDKARNILSVLEDMGTTEQMRTELEDLGIIFQYPKPKKLIKYLLDIGLGEDENETVLDFFSGSATTAHALLESNYEKGIKRNCISIQIPEKIDSKSTAFKAGYNSIAEIGKERIRRVGKKILEELESRNKQLKLGEEAKDTSKLDVGFRVYKLDSTNMQDVYYHPSQVNQEQLSLSISNVKEGRTPEDLLTQVILDLGLELNLPIEVKNMQGNNMFFVQGNSLVACFDDSIDFGIVDEIAKAKPLRVIFKDAGFRDDKDRINLEERFKRLSPETQIRVI